MLIEHRCSPDMHGGFLMYLKEGTWPGHVLEHVIFELQNLVGMLGGFDKVHKIPVRGVYKVVIHAWREDVTRTVLFVARGLATATIEDRPYDVGVAVETLCDLVGEQCLGPSAVYIVGAADDHNVLSVRLSDSNLV